MTIETKKFLNYKNLKEETRTGLNSKIIEEKETQINYYISKFTKKSKQSNDKLSYEKKDFIKANNCIYFDIETVEIGQLMVDNDDLIENITEKQEKEDFIKSSGRKSFLNTTTANSIKQFSFLIPKTLKRIVNLILNNKYETFEVKSENKFLEYLDIQEKEEYYTFTYYNIDSFLCREYLYNFVYETLATHRMSTKIIGFNSNKFDTLIFKQLEEEKGITLQLQNKDKSIEMFFDNSNKKRIHFIDLIQMSFNFSCPKLKNLGDFVGFPKLENDIAMNKEEFIKYNIRDCEILYEFTKILNNKYKIFDSNFSRYARNENHRYLFEEVENLKGIDYISTSAAINNFDIAGGRTEAYYCHIQNPYYIDINSLYTSGRVVLDTVIPQVSGTKAKYDLKKVQYNEDFYTAIYTFSEYFFSKAIKNDFFDYKSNAKEYDNYFKHTFYIGKFKIKGFKETIPFHIKEKIKFYFPFNIKKDNRRVFSLIENETYDIGYYMVMFLAFFDFEIVELYTMSKGEDIFKPMLINLYEERKIEKEKKDGGIQLLKKLLMNTSWGIFATKNGNNKKIVNKEEIERLNTLDRKTLKEKVFIERGNETFTIKKHGEDYFKEQINKQQKWATNSLPSLAKNIVDNGHFIMYSFMLNLIFDNEEKYKIYYTDTDSFMINEDFYNAINENGFIGEDLGLFSNEYKNNTIEEAIFLAPKTYAYKLDNGKCVKVLKGVRDWKTVITQQSLNSSFRTFEKVALNPYQEQKRFLFNNEFLNGSGYGISRELIEKYEEAKNWETDLKKLKEYEEKQEQNKN